MGSTIANREVMIEIVMCIGEGRVDQLCEIHLWNKFETFLVRQEDFVVLQLSTIAKEV